MLAELFRKAFLIGLGGILLICVIGGVLALRSPKNPPAEFLQDDANPARHQASDPKSGMRRLATARVQDDLLRLGFDVQVKYVEGRDDTMVIFGPSVNRPFAYNLMRRADFQKLLRSTKFREVTFMDDFNFPTFVQSFNVN